MRDCSLGLRLVSVAVALGCSSAKPTTSSLASGGAGASAGNGGASTVAGGAPMAAGTSSVASSAGAMSGGTSGAGGSASGGQNDGGGGGAGDASGSGGAPPDSKSGGCGKPAPADFTPEMYVRKGLPDVAKSSVALLRTVGRRQFTHAIAVAAQLRLRTFTLLIRTYDDARRAVTFLCGRATDPNSIAPSLYGGRKRRKGKADPQGSSDMKSEQEVPDGSSRQEAVGRLAAGPFTQNQ